MSATTRSSLPSSRAGSSIPAPRSTARPARPTRPLDPPDDDTGAPDGRSTRWDDHRAARRTSLVHAARKAVHRHGADVSMEEIAAFAGTSKSIIYRYFEDKNGLQIAVGEAVVHEIRDALEAALAAADSPRQGLEAMVDTYLAMIEHSPNVYYFVTRTGSIIGNDAGPRVTGDGRPPLMTFADTITSLMARALLGGGILDDVSAVAWASGAASFVRGTGEWWLAQRDAPGTPAREQLSAQLGGWLWEGPTAASASTRSTASVRTTSTSQES
ncbi:TetR/AcrR family transcriptional regulator [Luteimicrobium subarcticum]|uniref:TetR family transcriptional regulator n=1 Tax=Luteimicrobium subarcticum TaxID=620910 RepID=A0A2M8WSB3_9MICO|nr:TetR/AcrR family transcriptional regulator [Luteimicrobium subarcticum]PJI93803.1 TetR family transcriptional regulator [Luteimicrobium subarcticum]